MDTDRLGAPTQGAVRDRRAPPDPGSSILFLDVDGVLNNADTKERIRCHDRLVDGFTGVDLLLLARLKSWLAERPFVSIVLSSTWRLNDAMRHELHSHGLRWIGLTPRLGMRGKEVEAWCARYKVKSYVIFDDIDQFDEPGQQDRLVLTCPLYGLTMDDLDKADAILRKDGRLAQLDK